MPIFVDAESLIGKRKANEDKHVIFSNMDGADKTRAPVNAYAVFDGHGGRFVSGFLRDLLVPMMTNIRMTLPLRKSVVYECIKYLQNVLKKDYYMKSVECGSTCLMALHYIKNNTEYLNIINIGDSRCVLCKGLLAVPLTLDHKPNFPMESCRINKSGGEVIYDSAGDFRIEGLSLSRAIGDLSASPHVTCEPDLYRYAITPNDKFIIFGCDGLYEAIPDNQDIVNFVLTNCFNVCTGQRTNTKIAKKLAEYAIQRGSTDNVTVIVVFLQ